MRCISAWGLYPLTACFNFCFAFEEASKKLTFRAYSQGFTSFLDPHSFSYTGIVGFNPQGLYRKYSFSAGGLWGLGWIKSVSQLVLAESFGGIALTFAG